MVVGAAAITALFVAEPRTDDRLVDEVGASTHVHTEGSREPCMADVVAIAAQPVAQPAREQAC